ncbi:DUF7878 domain-containing protein [Winogradskya humida]|uniref:DUF7878 domain-containing protein n=1 Tax=Winogradskya humida TaxID=113566 RepID=A0ABQ4A4L4_9ACTN|nr:hypothetical protein [Actinoplanes humidus]GIE25568.1 hypothetical protein Ahu01nite_086700 [Actinoplanes humidus]
MEIAFRGIGAADLRGSTLADLLINVEADMEVRDGGEVLYAERLFPVAELARELKKWKGEAFPGDFAFESLSFGQAGAVTISQESRGWVVGSVFVPGKRSGPVSWGELLVGLDEFIANVRLGVESLGFDADAILGVRGGEVR